MSTVEVPMQQAASPAPHSDAPHGTRGADRAFRAILTMFGLTVLAVPALMVLELIRSSRLAIDKFGLGFLGGSVWDPAREEFGALPFVYGTVVTSLIAIVLAVPVSLGLAIFLSDLAPHRIRKPLGFMVELLAAIPSVVYGFWGIAVLRPWLRDTVEPVMIKYFGYIPLFEGPPLGFGMFAAGVILAIMIVPTITSVSREVMQAVPQLHREAAVGLGACAWDTIRYAVLPSARSGIIGAIILGLNRALGETMAVTMMIGNVPKVSASIFHPGYSMASVIANEFVEATSDMYVSALSKIALLLFGVALLLNLFARWLVSSTKSKLEKRA
ncbi:phosphate ABC transporter permease subunit PstC [Sorangium sp. So ce448]|uniref:phosphate ABC transporter permease subunit PstC n=1 Tax=Sorangium sp. So ce448 TaxID=3133314 RepID=UPI003F5F7921